jgi:hypothetical protein
VDKTPKTVDNLYEMWITRSNIRKTLGKAFGEHGDNIFPNLYLCACASIFFDLFVQHPQPYVEGYFSVFAILETLTGMSSR